MVRNTPAVNIQQCCNRLLHAGFVHVYWCGFIDVTFVLLSQICKIHECCAASDLDLILWMMASISLVNSGLSYSERACNSRCRDSYSRPFLEQGIRATWSWPTLPLLPLCFLTISLWLASCSTSYLGSLSSFSESFRNT